MNEPFDRLESAVATATLDGIFRLNARRHPDGLALIDPPNRPVFTGGTARQLSYVQAEHAIAALAARLRDLALPQGCAVGLQLPNTVESIVAILAAISAGLVPAPLPLLWQPQETVRALRAIDAGALITCGRVAETKHAELALHIAAETYSIRYVCAFGGEVPDGIVPLDDIWTDGATASEPQTVTAAADTAVITFDIGSHGPAPVARTHTELMVGGLAAVLETGLPHQAAILGTMLTSSFAVLASTIVPWLLSGGTLALHHPFDLDSFARQIAQSPAALAVLPGPLVSKLADAGAIGTAPAKISAIWRAPEQQRLSPPWRGPAPLVDVLAFGEVALLPLRRGADGHPATLLAGSQKAPSTAADAAVLMTLARTDMGTLAVGGPMVPRALRSRPEQATEMVDTGYSCKIDPQNNLLTIEARTAPADGVAFAGRAASA